MTGQRTAFALFTDDRYLDIAQAAALHLARTEPEHDVVLFHEGSLAPSARLAEATNLHVEKNRLMASVPADLPCNDACPPIVYARLFIPEILVDRYDRIVILDADTMRTAPLGPVFSLPFDGAPILAARDYGYVTAPGSDDRAAIRRRMETFGIVGEDYFNAGFLCIDTRAWMASGATTSIDRWLSEVKPVGGNFEQDYLNWLFATRWGMLSPAWNCQTPIFDMGVDAIVPPRLLHFTARNKPWLVGERHFEPRVVAYFDEILAGVDRTASVPPTTAGQRLSDLLYEWRYRSPFYAGKRRRRGDKWRAWREAVVQSIARDTAEGRFRDVVHGITQVATDDPMRDRRIRFMRRGISCR